jgi:hypothetical protein
MAISRYEHGDTTVMSMATVTRLTAWFEAQRVYCGPRDGVCCGVNVFRSERWLGLACYQLLQDHGIQPSSADLLAAGDRVRGKPDVQQPTD